MYLISKLLNKFPHLDILDIANFLAGKWLSTIIGILYMAYLIFAVSILLRSFSEGLKVIFFPRTSVPTIMLLFLVAIVMATRLGFKTVARSSLFVIPLVSFTVLFIFFANLKNFTFQGTFPLLGEGMQSTFFAGISNLFAFGGITYLYFIPPHLKEEKSYKKIALTSIVVSGTFLLFSVATLVFLSPTVIIKEEVFPMYLASRYIEFSRFFQRLDAVFLLIWIISVTLFLSISFSFTTQIFQKMLHLQSNKWYIGLFSLIVFGVGLIPSDMYTIVFLENTVYKYIVLILVLIISLTLLVLANFKYARLQKKKGEVLVDKASL